MLDGHTADLIVVVAKGEKGLSFFTVPGDAPGLERRALKVMDPTRKQARLEFRGVEAELLGEEGGGAAPFAEDDDAGRSLPGERNGRWRGAAAAFGA